MGFDVVLFTIFSLGFVIIGKILLDLHIQNPLIKKYETPPDHHRRADHGTFEHCLCTTHG